MIDSSAATALPLAEDLQASASNSAPSLRPTPHPDKPAWGLGAALFVWLTSVFLIILMPLLFLLPYAASKGLRPGSADFLRSLAELALSDKTAVLLQVISILPSHLLTFALIWLVVTQFRQQPFLQAIGWGRPAYGDFVWVGLGVLLFGVGATLAWLFGTPKPTQLEQIVNSSLAARYTISILAVGTAPFLEEFLYRGVLYAPLQKLAGAPTAVVIVLALFTVIHVPQYWPNVGVIAAVAVLSIALTLVRAFTGRLLPCIIIHLVFNGIQAVLLIVEPYTQRFVPPTEPVNPTFILLPLLHLIR